MKELWFLVAGLMVLLLSACETAATVTDVSYPENGKVGVVFLTDESPLHVHSGITAFDSYDQELPQRWDVEGTALRHLRTRLTQVEQIEPTPAIAAAESTVAINFVSGKWSLRKELGSEFEQLASSHDLAAIVVVEPYPFGLNYRSTNKPKGYGVITRCDKTCKARTLHHVLVRVFSVNPVALIGSSAHTKNMYNPFDNQKTVRARILGEFEPETFKKSKEVPGELVDQASERFYKYLKAEIDSALAAAGIAPG